MKDINKGRLFLGLATLLLIELHYMFLDNANWDYRMVLILLFPFGYLYFCLSYVFYLSFKRNIKC